MHTSPLQDLAEITAFLHKHLPPSVNAREVPFLYHAPKSTSHGLAKIQSRNLVLSLTPTRGFYEAINSRRHAIGFLHRPWTLNRRALRKDTTVFACHASFDEHLTVGWNVALAERLGLDVHDALCVKGYKDNPDRKIGLIARFDGGTTRSVHDLSDILKLEHAGVGGLHLPEEQAQPDSSNFHEGEASDNEDGGVQLPPSQVLSRCHDIGVVAIMNAFHEEEIRRVLTACSEKGWIADDKDGSSILYLTGAARDYGLEAIRRVGMPAFCVGHRACEEWGIRFLANELRKEWTDLDVVEVLEEEEAPLKKAKPADGAV